MHNKLTEHPGSIPASIYPIGIWFPYTHGPESATGIGNEGNRPLMDKVFGIQS